MQTSSKPALNHSLHWANNGICSFSTRRNKTSKSSIACPGYLRRDADEVACLCHRCLAALMDSWELRRFLSPIANPPVVGNVALARRGGSAESQAGVHPSRGISRRSALRLDAWYLARLVSSTLPLSLPPLLGRLRRMICPRRSGAADRSSILPVLLPSRRSLVQGI